MNAISCPVDRTSSTQAKIALFRIPSGGRRRDSLALSGHDADGQPFVAGVYPLLRDETCFFRIQTDLAHRVFYLATFDEAVYVLHAFEKRTRKTPSQEVTLARDRYRALLKKRAEDAKEK